jgi:hypothetical protein
MNFIDFINNKNRINKNHRSINEGILTKDIDNAHQLMLNLFKKKIDKNVVIDNSKRSTKLIRKKDNKIATTVTFIKFNINKTHIDMMWALNYITSDTSQEVYSIDFFTGEQAERLFFKNGEAVSALTIYTLGQSVAYFLPLICYVANNKDFTIGKQDAKDIVNAQITETLGNTYRKWYYGAQCFNVYEEMSVETIDNAFHIAQGHHLVDNGDGFIWETEAEDIKKQVRRAEVESWKTKNDSPEARRRSLDLDRDYRDICTAIRGGATTLKDIELSIGRNVRVEIIDDPSIIQMQKDLNKKKKDPEQAFKEMRGYVKTVINGLQPGLILCGAPGIGKTYRVLEQLKGENYINGKNLYIIKGKATPRQLYLTLYEYRKYGDIILIDDADALVGPKAQEDCINILKAALDSTSSDEGRLVSYKISGDLLDDEKQPVPKTMYFNGAVIIITNYDISSLDTALRGRVFTQSLDFTTEQLLDIIKDIIPAIDPEHLSVASKMKAYDYIKELAHNTSNIEISIRTFATCARIFQICDADIDFNDDDAKSMIKEQLENNFLKGGRRKKF